jgi:hypothetical protein
LGYLPTTFGLASDLLGRRAQSIYVLRCELIGEKRGHLNPRKVCARGRDDKKGQPQIARRGVGAHPENASLPAPLENLPHRAIRKGRLAADESSARRRQKSLGGSTVRIISIDHPRQAYQRIKVA